MFFFLTRFDSKVGKGWLIISHQAEVTSFSDYSVTNYISSVYVFPGLYQNIVWIKLS